MKKKVMAILFIIAMCSGCIVTTNKNICIHIHESSKISIDAAVSGSDPKDSFRDNKADIKVPLVGN